MYRLLVKLPFLLLMFSLVVTAAEAATVPFTEDFTASVSNWADASGGALLTHVAAGGPDGGAFASTSLTPAGAGGSSVVLFRGQDEFNSSGHAFEGNWIADSVGKITAYVRHNAPQPLTFFGRFSLPANFSGATGVQFAPVPPQTWTQLSFAVTPSNPSLVTFEGSDFNTVFSNVGHVQFGVSVPAALNAATTPITFDLDKVALVPTPEPAGALLTMIAVFGVGLFRRGR